MPDIDNVGNSFSFKMPIGPHNYNNGNTEFIPPDLKEVGEEYLGQVCGEKNPTPKQSERAAHIILGQYSYLPPVWIDGELRYYDELAREVCDALYEEEAFSMVSVEVDQRGVVEVNLTALVSTDERKILEKIYLGEGVRLIDSDGDSYAVPPEQLRQTLLENTKINLIGGEPGIGVEKYLNDKGELCLKISAPAADVPLNGQRSYQFSLEIKPEKETVSREQTSVRQITDTTGNTISVPVFTEKVEVISLFEGRLSFMGEVKVNYKPYARKAVRESAAPSLGRSLQIERN
ncbi:hypothetical protein A2526_01970 [candidate division WOR-1 bacterium RIFOXYD2_FULL_36_8]|uniref:Uncharacterized protein n=1 Tax=candidate division WOR-1 bacterium RIFOXYB2_FULL_36_35 TaxID=1802578 RepID=A0A1F4S390_UNCSA|nr:MAG: hypothetical protein A2230_06415 [candidate division WOR-1 bacterium RIFOXYA2_FULL_36_21]OGC14890.1 MAG: hypothetical protein A2290_07315 [candidate division WOR-1 bacterium RIFOXYB2_FULL_36_35]OGC16720.1 MAG: hypothetical protein A2282_03870 [candidate division WOR-1 bacterium RIFOXYA12_FULL_36_13]OGC38212.1 MAG: hypothetical protein A2526_01970 [candidate division WOR-1 bacterium RIFOXYD2_FULL_36_8]